VSDPNDPVTHHLEANILQPQSPTITAAVLTVTRPEELAPALRQRDRSVAIQNAELEPQFARIHFFQGREGTYRYLGTLMAMLLILLMALRYGFDVRLLLDRKLEKTDLYFTLTPPK
jgi:hypothetical protein